MQLDLLRRSYDRFAPKYDEIFEPQQAPKIAALAGALPRPLPEPMLDLGAGTGLASRMLHAPMIQVDASRGMLSRATGRRAQADMRRLPFADQTFGAILSVTALLDFIDPGPSIAEMARVLRPTGWLALSVLKIENIAALQDALADHGFAIVERLDLEQDLGFICRPLNPR